MKIKTFISKINFSNRIISIAQSKLQNSCSNDSLLSNYAQQIELNKNALQKNNNLINNGIGMQEVK